LGKKAPAKKGKGVVLLRGEIKNWLVTRHGNVCAERPKNWTKRGKKKEKEGGQWGG